MTRFIAVEGEGSAWIYDDQTGLPANLVFYGEDYFEHAQKCAKRMNQEEADEVQVFTEWMEL